MILQPLAQRKSQARAQHRDLYMLAIMSSSLMPLKPITSSTSQV